MSNPKVESHLSRPSIPYSFVPNHKDIMLALMQSPLSGREFRFVIAILNQTDGYFREEDSLSAQFLSRLTRIDFPHVNLIRRSLLDKGILGVRQEGNKSFYRVLPAREWKINRKRLKSSPKTVKPLTENGYVGGDKGGDLIENPIRKPLIEEQVPSNRKRLKAPSPEWFGVLSELPGFKKRDYDRTILQVETACHEAGIDSMSVAKSFAAYYTAHRMRLGWADPVSALRRTLHMEIAKLKGATLPLKSTRREKLATEEEVRTTDWFGQPVRREEHERVSQPR